MCRGCSTRAQKVLNSKVFVVRVSDVPMDVTMVCEAVPACLSRDSNCIHFVSYRGG